MGVPDGSVMLQITRHGSPLGSEEMSDPASKVLASWVWNGPRTVPSVAFADFGWSIASTSNDSPRTSDSRMNSCSLLAREFATQYVRFVKIVLGYILTCLTSVLICPTLTRKSSPAIHSLVLNLVSRAKSCKCVTSRSRMNFVRTSSPCELIRIVFSVILSAVRFFASGSALLEDGFAMMMFVISWDEGKINWVWLRVSRQVCSYC